MQIPAMIKRLSPKKTKLKQLMALLLLVCLIFAGSQPASAWKVNTHVYSANLVLEEILASNGYVDIAPFGRFKVIPEYLDAIRSFPDYYRAGAMGPDVFPDIYVGQMVIHPGQGGWTSGDWIAVLWRAVNKLNSTPSASAQLGVSWFVTPASDSIRIDNKKQCMAFILGFMTHAAGDFFGHSYVNHWAGGPWPPISDGVDQEEINNIIRHNVIEAYIDNKIPAVYTTYAKNRIQAPRQFIFDNMVSNGLKVDTDNLHNDDSDIAGGYGLDDSFALHFKLFYDMRNTLKEFCLTTSDLNFLMRWYAEAWIRDIDTGLSEWVVTNEKVAQHLLGPDGMKKAGEDITDWASHNLLSMLGFPDVTQDVMNAVGDVADFVAGFVPQAVKDEYEALKVSFLDTFMGWVLPITYTELNEIFKNPASYLQRTELFPAGSESVLLSDMGNFSMSTQTSDLTFVPFKNTLTLAKLTLIGYDGINELRVRAGNPKIQPPALADPFICFVNSLDVGYDWNAPDMGNCSLWTNQADRERIAKVIFNFDGVTPRATPTFTDMTVGPVYSFTTVSAGNRNIAVHYQGAPDEVNAVIGLYPAGNADPNSATSWQYTQRRLSGDVVFTPPFTSGLYEFRIYSDQNILLGKSTTIQVIGLEDQPKPAVVPVFTQLTKGPVYSALNGASGGSGTAGTTTTAPAGTIPTVSTLSVHYANGPAENNAIIGLYDVNDPDPARALSWRLLSGKTSGDLVVTVPAAKGKYEFRIYSAKNVPLGKSAAVEVLGPQPDNSLPVTISAVAGSNGVLLSWKVPNGSQARGGYWVYRGTVSKAQSATPLFAAPVLVPDRRLSDGQLSYSVLDSGVNNGQTYYYVVKPMGAGGGIGKTSNEVSSKPLATAKPLRDDQPKSSMHVKIAVPDMTINGKAKKAYDPGRRVVPLISGGRLFVPIQAVVAEMGGTVKYDARAKTLAITYKDTRLDMTVGKTAMKVTRLDASGSGAAVGTATNQTAVAAPFVSAAGKPMVCVETMAAWLMCHVELNMTDKSALLWYGPIWTAMPKGNGLAADYRAADRVFPKEADDTLTLPGGSDVLPGLDTKPPVIAQPSGSTPSLPTDSPFTKDQLIAAAQAWAGVWQTDRGTVTIQYANEVLTAVVTGSAQQWVFRDIRLSPGNAVGAMLNFIVGKVDRDGASYGDLWFRIMDDGTLRGIVMPTGGTTPDQWSGSR